MLNAEPVRGLTLRALLTGAVLVFVWLAYDLTMVPHPRLGAIEVLCLIGFGAVFTIFALHAFNGLLPRSRRLSTQELTVIYAMVAVAIPWGILIRSTIEAPLRMAILYKAKDDPTAGWLTPFWCPTSRDVIQQYRVGGVPFDEIRWHAWRAPMLYWAGMLVSFQAFAICVVLFFRQLFVDRERLPFPMAQLGRSVIEETSRAGRSPSAGEGPPRTIDPPDTSGRLRAAARVAFIVGLLFCAPGILSVQPFGTQPIPMNSLYYGTSTGIIPGVKTALSWDPFVILFLMFFPLDVLLTVVVVHVGLMIAIPMLCSWMGIPIPVVSTWRVQILGMGGLLGLAFWTVFFNRRILWGYVKRAFTGDRLESHDNPVGYRWVVPAMVLSFAAFVTLMVVGLIDWTQPIEQSHLYQHLRSHVISLTVCLFIIVVLLMAVLRQSGEQGWHYHSPWSVAFVLGSVNAQYLNQGADLGLHRTPPAFLGAGNVLNFGAFHNTFGPHLHLMYSLKIASETNTRTRDILTAVLLTLIVSLVIVIPAYLVIIHHYGLEHGAAAQGFGNFWNYAQSHHAIGYGAIPSWMRRVPPYVSLSLGVAIIGVVMYLRREYVGFPFSPVGVVIAAGLSYFSHYSTGQIWLPIAIVLVVKTMVYKWFGVKVFRERVIPVVVYAMMGLMTGMFLYKLLFMVMGHSILQAE